MATMQDAHEGRVRTVPPWVADADDADEVDYLLPQLPRRPTNTVPAGHHFLPSPKTNAPRGRKYDHLREKSPVVLGSPSIAQNASRWADFSRPTPGMLPTSPEGQVVDEKWWTENMPTYEGESSVRPQSDQPLIPGFWLFTPEKRERALSKAHIETVLTAAQRTLMRNGFVPLSIRMVVLVFSVLALSLAASIFQKTDHAAYCKRGSSTYMAIIVDTIAIAYILWITWDEYTSAPLGLRSPYAKMRLVFLDLFFIIFDSANLSIAFQYLTDPSWACRNDDLDANRPGEDVSSCLKDESICDRQKALVGTLLVACVAWLFTFTISMARLMDKVANR